MPSVALDSSCLYALFEPKDQGHAVSTQFLASFEGELVSNIAVLTEVIYLLNYSVRTQCAFIQFAARSITIDDETAGDLPRIAEIMRKYHDLPADFADAALLAMCERLGIGEIATFDSDFEVYRLANGKALVNVTAA